MIAPARLLRRLVLAQAGDEAAWVAAHLDALTPADRAEADAAVPAWRLDRWSLDGAARMLALLKQYGGERVIVDGACDWGISGRLGVARTAKPALESGVADATVRAVCYGNALGAYGESGQMRESDWLDPPAIDQRTLYADNSILRGRREPRIEALAARSAGEPPTE